MSRAGLTAFILVYDPTIVLTESFKIDLNSKAIDQNF